MNDEKLYHEVDSFTLGEHWQFAADTDRIAVAQTDGEVTLFDTGGHETVSLPDSLSALEMERYLLSLSEDEVSAYTTSGVELWTQTVPGATDIVTFGEKDVLAVLTADGDVVGLDLETGGRLFETRRPHDDFTDTYVAGGNGLVCIGAWSFVVCLDTAGSVVVDRNLDSTIEGVSILDTFVVVALKDGTVVTLDPETGDTQWSNSAQLRHLSARGRTQVPALTDSGAALIHAEGRIQQLAVETGKRIIGSTDGSVLGIADETAIRLYRRGPPPSAQLESDVLTTELDTETPVRVYVENTGSESVDTTISLDSSQPFRATTQRIPLELDAGNSREVAFRLQELPPTDQFEYLLLVDDTEIERGSIPIVRNVDLAEAVAVDVTRQQVGSDAVVAQSSIKNTSNTTLDTVRIEDETVTGLQPGETRTVEHAVPLDGSDRTVQVELANGNTTETIERRLPVPENAVQVDIARGDEEIPCLDIEVEPTVQAPLRGELTVALPEDVTVSRDVELDEHERLTLVVFLPPPVSTRDEIPVVVESPLLATETRAHIRGWNESTVRRADWASDAAGTQRVDQDSQTPQERRSQTSQGRGSQTSRSRDAQTPQDRDSQTSRDRDSQTSQESQQVRDETAQRGAAGPTQRDDTGKAGEPVDEPALNVERALPQQAERGAVFVERLRITNTSRQTVDEVTVSDAFDQYRIDELGGGDELIVERNHAVFETGVRELPPVQVETERTSAHELRVVEPAIDCRATATYDNTTGELRVTVTVSNESKRQCRISRAGIDISATDGGQMWEFEEPFVVGPGETETRTHRTDLPSERQLEERTRLVVVECAQDGDKNRYRTLAPLTEAAASDDVPVSVTLVDRTRLITETQGTVDIAVVNESQIPLDDVTITGEGSMVLEAILAQDSKTVPRLAPGERKTVLVDVEPEATDTATFDVVVEGTLDGEPVTQRLTFAGPVAQTGAEWEENAYLDEWTTESGESTQAELEDTHLVTRLRPTEEGNHR